MKRYPLLYPKSKTNNIPGFMSDAKDITGGNFYALCVSNNMYTSQKTL